VQNLVIVRLLSVDEPHDGFLAVIHIACAPTGGDQADVVGLQELRSQDFIACRWYCQGLQEHFHIYNL
jgi:hypothetical protein